MNDHNQRATQVLDKARQAHAAKEYETSLASYEDRLEKHDETMEIFVSKPELGADFIQEMKGMFAKDIDNIIKVLQASGRTEEAGVVAAKAKADLEKRNYIHTLPA